MYSNAEINSKFIVSLFEHETTRAVAVCGEREREIER